MTGLDSYIQKSFELLDEIGTLKDENGKSQAELKSLKEKYEAIGKLKDDLSCERKNLEEKSLKLEEQLNAISSECEGKDKAIVELSAKVRILYQIECL